jgi:uncharacterized protein (DUF952 family)
LFWVDAAIIGTAPRGVKRIPRRIDDPATPRDPASHSCRRLEQPTRPRGVSARGFAADGFIHCTDGEALVVEVGNRYYTKDLRTFCLLSIDVARVQARTIYEDEAHVYPHIYGALNVDAVIDVRTVIRAGDGTFLAIGDSQPDLLPRQG